MTTKPTIVCPTCHQPVSLDDAEDGGPVRCGGCGTEIARAEQPGDPASAS